MYVNKQRAKLDENELLSVTLSPLLASPEHKSLSLGALLRLESGNPDLAEKVAVLANKILHSECIEDFHVSVIGLVISPPGISSGPSVIDQFKDFKIPIELPKSSDGSSGASLIDSSALKENLKLSSLGLKMEGIEFKTLPKSALALSANVGYNNKLPIKVVLPYLKAEVSVQDVPLVEQTILGIDLSDGAGNMSPSAHLYFQQQDTYIQDHVAKIVAEITEKNRIESKVSMRGFYFGVSETDR